MQKLHRVALGCLLLSSAGCAVHPLPQNYSGVDTADIVRHVRCEARSAVEDNIIQWLGNKDRLSGLLNQHEPQRVAAEARIVAGLNVDPRVPINFSENDYPDEHFDPDVVRSGEQKKWTDRAIIKLFANSAVALDFTFDMAEIDNLDTTLDFLGILKHTALSAALNGGFDRTRENIRTFTVTDTISGLLNMKNPQAYCRQYASVNNLIYPVTGDIGIGEIVHTFAVLSLFSNLDGTGHKGPPTIGDTLNFTTKISGSLAPKVVLASAFRGAQLLDASLTASSSRTDLHKVIVALALPPPKEQDTKPATTGTFVTASGTGAEVLAAQTINQIIFRFELGRAGAGALTAINQ